MADTIEKAAGPEISAIVVVPFEFRRLERTLERLKKQTAAGRMEVVFVVKDREEMPADTSGWSRFHGWKVVEAGAIGSIGGAFFAGIKQAGAPVVALTEDHSFPDEKWAETFILKHKDDWAVVGPCMKNGNPVNGLSWADFYQAYGEWAEPAAECSPHTLPGHNSSYKRDVLLGLGERLKDYMQAESVMHRQLGLTGHRLLLAPETCTTHLNFTTWRAYMPSRYFSGRMYAAVWSKEWPRARRYFYAAASPLIPFIRLWRIEKCVLRRKDYRRALTSLPALFAGLVSEAFGQMRGYASGAGDACEKLAKYEFNRESGG